MKTFLYKILLQRFPKEFIMTPLKNPSHRNILFKKPDTNNETSRQ